ncbi:hypothetical protein [Undibacterium sp. TS12]|uniref:hypothetical protein n=1 Tax=Undibacterium sp. TS12 TaxID=2908202 RepID=UPI001F4CA21C|nr:hypothetical protein [Undibacterium sp. TS12]MCH8620262.1 hypothetical protein [Undibacterium sp. TS12]
MNVFNTAIIAWGHSHPYMAADCHPGDARTAPGPILTPYSPDNATQRTDVTVLTSVVKLSYPLIPKTEQEKPAHQEPPLKPQKETPHPAKKSATTSTTSPDKLPVPQATEKSNTKITAGVEADASAKSSINLTQLRSQATLLARESAKSSASESGNQGILGDYYGSYQGADTVRFILTLTIK